MGRTSNKEFFSLTNRHNCRKYYFNVKLKAIQWDVDDLSFEPNVVHTKHKHVQVKNKRKHNDLASESISSYIMCTRRKYAQSAERDTVCVKYKNIFDTNFKRFVLEDLFYLYEGTKVYVALKKDSTFMKSS